MMLSPYRVLDLTDEKGFVCGKVLAELGADVIKIEKPGGDIARNIEPFWHDIPDPEMSLYWLAHNVGKRGVTLDIERDDGQVIFNRLVKTADILVESFAPGYLEAIGLGYQHCSRINPGIIMTSITPHGQDGPYKDFKGYDLQAQAMGGTVYICGYPGEAPVSWGGLQAYYQAGLQAGVGTMIALWHREVTGEGEHIDVSIREAMTVLTTTEAPVADWVESGTIKQRWGGSQEDMAGGLLRWFYPCKDGYVIWRFAVGTMGHMTNSFVAWMEEEGMAANLRDEVPDWTEIGLTKVSQAQISRWEQIFTHFFLTKTKKELLDEALKRSIILYPVSNMADVLGNAQLQSRGYWMELASPALGSSMKYPGASFKASEAPTGLRCRAPLIGEHNKEIYVGELGYSGKQLRLLIESGIV